MPSAKFRASVDGFTNWVGYKRKTLADAMIDWVDFCDDTETPQQHMHNVQKDEEENTHRVPLRKVAGMMNTTSSISRVLSHAEAMSDIFSL